MATQRIRAYRIGPKTGLEASTTTAFWTVDRVTSAPLTNRSAELICRLHLQGGWDCRRTLWGNVLTICQIL